jgi:threonine synthase
VPLKSSKHRLDQIEATGASVEPFDGTYEEAVHASRARAIAEDWHDANPGPKNQDVGRRAYAALARELVQELPRQADVIAVPTGNGTTIQGLHHGLEELLRTGKISKLPHLVAASTKMGNPIVWSLAKGQGSIEDLDDHEVWPSETSEPLANVHAFDGEAAVAAVRATQGWGYAASDAELVALAKQIKRAEGLDVLPAGTAGVAALHFAAKLGRLDPNGLHVAILSGRP